MRLTSHQRGYGARWQRERAVFLAAHPLCVKCGASGLTVPASVVDHVVPHRGDPALFWDQANWQALCQPHHDQTKSQEEHRGFHGAVDQDGWPVDPRHPANMARVGA